MAELKDWLDTYKLPVKEQPQYLTIEELIKLSDVELQDEINKLRSKLGMRKEQPQNATFESALEAELNKIPYTKHVDDGQYNDGQLAGFEKGAEWARGRSFPAEDGPWKFEVHHDQGPEDCDEWVTITDGNVTLRFDQHQDEEGEEKIVALLNQLKAKISYDRSAEHVVGYLQEQLDALRASNPSGITWVRASERLPNHKNDVSLKIDGQKYSVGKMQLGLLLVDLWEGYADTTQLLERIYWLDESSPASQGREVGYKEPKSDFAHLGQEAEWIINMVYEGAALWQQEYDACRRILQELVSLKLVKEREGKTTEYQERQPKAWSTAIEFLNKYQHF
jgi:hypothetical protein